jgi:hypothetical protein
MTPFIQKLFFNKELADPNEIEVIDPIFVEPENNVERFYEWLKKCNNQFLHDNEKITNSFNLIK